MPLEDLRGRIDDVDDRLLELVEKRVELAERIGQVKKKKGIDVYDPDREGEVLSRLTGKTKLRKDFIRRLFEDIIGYCRENE